MLPFQEADTIPETPWICEVCQVCLCVDVYVLYVCLQVYVTV